MAAALPIIMAAASIGGGVMDLIQGQKQAEAQRKLGEFQKKQADINAVYADMQAEDAVYRGEQTALEVNKRGAQMRGTQRAAYAAQGVKSDVGIGAEMQAETVQLSKLDEITVRNNAKREAWGYKAQAKDLRRQGQMALMGAQNAASNSLMTGGLGFLKGLGGAAYGLGNAYGWGGSSTPNITADSAKNSYSVPSYFSGGRQYA